MVNIYMNSPYPSTDKVYSHELNKGHSRILTIAFWNGSTAVNLSNNTVTATFVCNGYLIAENVSCSIQNDNIIQLDISSTDNYTIIPGDMLIEFRIKQGSAELYPPAAMVVHVLPSITDDAQVTPESYGTVSEILQEVAEARGGYANLDARLDAITCFVDLGEADASAFDSNIELGKIYHIHISGEYDQYIFYTVYDTDSAIKTQFRYGDSGVEYRQLTSGTWSDWKIGIDPLFVQRVEDIEDFIPDALTFESETISSLSTLNEAYYAMMSKKYCFKITSTAASILAVPNGTLAEMSVVEADGNIQRFLTFPSIKGLSYVQTVNSIAPSWSAGDWTITNGWIKGPLVNGTNVSIKNGAEYYGTDINTIGFHYPSGDFETYIRISFASSGTITVTFPTSSYIGDVPTFANGETWEISIKNGVIVAGKITSGS